MVGAARNGIATLVAITAAIAPISVGATPEGMLYPPQALDKAPSTTALGEALGDARLILNEVNEPAAFAAEIARAIGAHPAFHSQASRREQARAGARAERAALFPQISASVTGDYVIARDFSPGTENVVESLRPGAQLNAGLSVSQLVFDGGATFRRIARAKAVARQSELSLAERTNQLALAGLSAYQDVLAHQALSRAGEEFIRRHEQLLSDVKERERLGAGTKADVMRASARLAASRARVSQIIESASLAELRYEEFFRKPPGQLGTISFDAFAPATRAQAVETALARMPDIGIANAQKDAAVAAYQAEKAGRLPQLRASVGASSFDITQGADDYDVRAGVSLNYDIFSGGARRNAIASARAEAEQFRMEEAQVKREIERDAAIAFERRRASADRLDDLADAVVAQKAARDLVAERYKAARGDLIDLLQAENDYFESVVAYVAGSGERELTTFELMEFTGDLLRFFSPANLESAGGYDG